VLFGSPGLSEPRPSGSGLLRLPSTVSLGVVTPTGVEIVFLLSLGQLLDTIVLALAGLIPRIALPSPYFA